MEAGGGGDGTETCMSATLDRDAEMRSGEEPVVMLRNL